MSIINTIDTSFLFSIGAVMSVMYVIYETVKYVIVGTKILYHKIKEHMSSY